MKPVRWLSLLSILVLVSTHALGQERDKPIIVSPLIGDTLDATERDHYQLFPNIVGFQRAVFYLNPDSSLRVKVALLQDGVKQDTVIERYHTLAALRNYFEQVTLGETKGRNGSEIVLLLNNGRKITGELFSVRDTALVISTVEVDKVNDLATLSAGIIVVPSQDILHVTIEGKSNVLAGMGWGILIGAGGGALFGYAGHREPALFTASEDAFIGGILLGLCGLVVGTIVGIATSTSDKEIEPLPNHDFSSLRPFTRFPANEPEWLRLIK